VNGAELIGFGQAAVFALLILLILRSPGPR
jgi:hypothetical protein